MDGAEAGDRATLVMSGEADSQGVDSLRVGEQNEGEVRVEGGAELSGEGDMVIGGGDEGIVSVEGEDSRTIFDGQIEVKENGGLQIADHGRVESEGDAQFAAQSVLEIDDSAAAFNSPSGFEGYLETDGDLAFDQEATFDLTLGQMQDDYALISVGNELDLNNATFDLSLAGAFDAVIGDTIDLIAYGDAGVVGEFAGFGQGETFNEGGFTFQIDYTAGNPGAGAVRLQVVPLPPAAWGGLALLGAAGAVRTLRARRTG